jgi:molybdopterin synthase sulfur carrier subunit
LSTKQYFATIIKSHHKQGEVLNYRTQDILCIEWKEITMVSITIRTIIGLKEILGQEVIEFHIPEGTTVKSLIALMVDKWGARLASYFSDAEEDRPLPKIRILVNGRDIGFLKGMETELQDGDEVLMLPPVGGG